MNKQEAQIHYGFRIPKSLLGRVDKLVDKMSQPGMTVKRAEVLRMATFRGLELLEAEMKTKR